VNQSSRVNTQQRLQPSNGRGNSSRPSSFPSQTSSRNTGRNPQTGNNNKFRFPSARKVAPKSSSQKRPAVILPGKSNKISHPQPSRGRNTSGNKSTVRPTRPGSFKVINPGKQLPKKSTLKPRAELPARSVPTLRRGGKPLAPGLKLVDRAPKSNDETGSPTQPDLNPEGSSGNMTAQYILPLPTPEEVADFVVEKSKDTGEAASGVGEAIGDAVSDAGDQVGGAVEQGADAVAGVTEAAGDAIGGPGSELAGHGADVIRDAGDLGRDVVGEAGDIAGDTARIGGDLVGRGTEELGKRVGDAVREVPESVEEAREDANEAIDQFQEDYLDHDPNPGNDAPPVDQT